MQALRSTARASASYLRDSSPRPSIAPESLRHVPLLLWINQQNYGCSLPYPLDEARIALDSGWPGAPSWHRSRRTYVAGQFAPGALSDRDDFFSL